MEGPDDLAAELHEPAVGQLGLLDPAAGAVAGLEHDHVDALRREVARGRQAGQTRAHDHHVVLAHARAPRRARLCGRGARCQASYAPVP